MTHYFYKIKVKTADEGGAGTDGNVFLRLIGDQGTSREIRLNSHIKGDAFKRDALDRIVLTSSDTGNIGWVYKIQLRLDKRYVSPNWRPDYIDVVSFEGSKRPDLVFPFLMGQGVSIPQELLLEARFLFDQWFDDDETVTKTWAGYALSQVGTPQNFRVSIDMATLRNNFRGTTDIEFGTQTKTVSSAKLQSAVEIFASTGSSKTVGTSVSVEGGVSVPVDGVTAQAKKSGTLTVEKKKEALESIKNERIFEQGQSIEETITETTVIPAGVYRLTLHVASYTCGLTSWTDGIGEETLFSIADKRGVEATGTWDFPNDKGSMPLAEYKRWRGAYRRLGGSPGDLRNFETEAKKQGWIEKSEN